MMAKTVPMKCLHNNKKIKIHHTNTQLNKKRKKKKYVLIHSYLLKLSTCYCVVFISSKPAYLPTVLTWVGMRSLEDLDKFGLDSTKKMHRCHTCPWPHICSSFGTSHIGIFHQETDICHNYQPSLCTDKSKHEYCLGCLEVSNHPIQQQKLHWYWEPWNRKKMNLDTCFKVFFKVILKYLFIILDGISLRQLYFSCNFIMISVFFKKIWNNSLKIIKYKVKR